MILCTIFFGCSERSTGEQFEVELQTKESEEMTFYAQVLEVGESSLLVEGVMAGYGETVRLYRVSLKDKESQVLDIDGNTIRLSDITEGSTIMIVFVDAIIETYPFQVSAIKIQVLEAAPPVTYHAKVLENHSDFLVVEGFEEFYEDSSRKVTLSLMENNLKNEILDANGNLIDLGDISEGSTIMVFFRSSPISEAYPGRIDSAIKIQVVE